MRPVAFFVVHDRGGELDQWSALRTAAKFDLLPRCTDNHLAIVSSAPGIALQAGDTHGYVVGTLFDDVVTASVRTELAPAEQTRILRSDGQDLIDRYWGAYVAFLWDRRTGLRHVVRDPSGGLGCYVYDDGRRLVVASRADILTAAIGHRPNINWRVLVSHVARPSIRAVDTALEGVEEQLGGTIMQVEAAHHTQKQAWNPWHFAARASAPPSWLEAAARLREVSDGCIQAWGRQSGRTIVAVSGGLDSSIVACSLAMDGLEPVCLTMATDDPAGDERTYARLLAQHIGCELIEEYEDLERIDLGRSDAAHLPRPVARAFAQSADIVHQRLAASHGANSFMTGGGGDNLFCFLRSVAPVVDAYLATGMSTTTIKAIRDVSRLTEVGIWSILKAVRTKRGRVGRPHLWPLRNEFLSEDARSLIEEPLDHPWLVPSPDMPPGKVMHVAWIMAIQNHLEGFGRDLLHPNRAPLMSQPLIEHCLGIASWTWCRDGRDRALARDAYADILPPEIYHRRLKGTPTSFVLEMVDARASEIEARLCDGRLAAQGLLDTAAISSFLRRPDPRQATNYLQLAIFADAEAWASAWSTDGALHLRSSRM